MLELSSINWAPVMHWNSVLLSVTNLKTKDILMWRYHLTRIGIPIKYQTIYILHIYYLSSQYHIGCLVVRSCKILKTWNSCFSIALKFSRHLSSTCCQGACQCQCQSNTSILTLKHWVTHGCVGSTVATDALVLKHQAIIIHNAD